MLGVGVRRNQILVSVYGQGKFRVLGSVDDALLQRPYACLYTGDGFFGQPEAGADLRTLTGDAAAAWLDSLPGRFVFVLMRPSLGRP